MSKLIINVLRASYFQQFPFMLCIFLLLVVFVRTCLKEITSRMCVLLVCLYIFTRKKNCTYIYFLFIRVQSLQTMFILYCPNCLRGLKAHHSLHLESGSDPGMHGTHADARQLHYWMGDGWLSGHHVAVLEHGTC